MPVKGNKSTRTIFDPHRQTVSFKGPCEQVVEVCQAMCCRSWDISLHREEYRSGAYKAEVFCTSTKDLCDDPRKHCVQRGFRLLKQADGACVYLTKGHLCSIYAHRPLVCRNFNCEQGWKLVPLNQKGQPAVIEYSFSGQSLSYASVPSWNDRIMRNPLLIRERILYDPRKKTCTMQVREATSCRQKTLLFLFSKPLMYNVLTGLSRNSGWQMPLSRLYQQFNKQPSTVCSKKDFRRAVSFLLESVLLYAVSQQD